MGLAYQSADNIKVSGNVAYSGVPGLLAAEFPNAGASTTLNLPATASAGFTWDLSREWSLQGEFAWTGWSTFKQLDIKFDAPTPNEVDQENWKNTTFFSVGTIWKVNERWALKTGLAYDESPVPDNYRTPRIPDANRRWVSLGATWAISKGWTADLGVTKIICHPVTMNLVSGTSSASPNYYKGNLSGNYDVGATVVAVSARYKF